MPPAKINPEQERVDGTPLLPDGLERTGQRSAGRTRALAAGAMLLIASVVGYNVSQNQQYIGFVAGSDEIGGQLPGCPPHEAPAPQLDVSSDGQMDGIIQIAFNPKAVDKAQEALVASETSSAYSNDTDDFDPLETFDQLQHMQDVLVDTIVLGDTGITVNVYSDEAGAFSLDKDAFTELALSSLMFDDYTHSGLDQNFACLRDRIINKREFAGTTLNLVIASDYRQAMINGRLQQVEGTYRIPANDQEWEAFWNQRKQQHPKIGFTPPRLFVGLPFGLWEWDKSGSYMVLAPGVPNAEKADRMVDRKIGHEFEHFFLDLVGANIDGNAAERSLRLVDTDIKEEMYPDGYPHAIVYVQRAA